MSDRLYGNMPGDFLERIISHAPYGILVLDASLRIMQINAAAGRILNVQQTDDVLGKPVSDLLEPQVFQEMCETGDTAYDACAYLPAYDRYVERTVIFDRESRNLVCFMRDVTAESAGTKKKEEIVSRTVEVTDKVIKKQMRVVQEIASLLGETTAETKIALSKLKESLKDE